MAAKPPRPGITDCPVEVLEHIFSFLPWVGDLQSVSLVCRFWSELAFSHSNMRRLELNLTTDDYDEAKKDLVERFRGLRESTRRYRNVLVKYSGRDTITNVEFNIILMILEFFGSTLEKFSCDEYLTVERVRQILIVTPNLKSLLVQTGNRDGEVEAFPVLPHLKELELYRNCFEINGWDIRAMAPNIVDLYVCFDECDDPVKSLRVLQQFAPDLKSLGIYSDEYYFPIEELHLPKCEVLNLSGDILGPNGSNAHEATQKEFLKKFSGLKEAYFECSIFESTLNVFTSSCTGLKKFHFKPNRLIKSLSFLENLKKLKVLELTGMVRSEMLAGCKPLPSVLKLRLEMYDTSSLNPRGRHRDFELVLSGLSKMLPNLIEMSVAIEENERGLSLDGCLRHVFRNFTHIKRLEIFNGAHINGDDLRSFEDLDRIVALEELSLNTFNIPITCLPKSATLRRLRLDMMHFNRNSLMSIPNKFPNLRYFQVSNSVDFTKREIRWIRTHLPNCIVHDLTVWKKNAPLFIRNSAR